MYPAEICENSSFSTSHIQCTFDLSSLVNHSIFEVVRYCLTVFSIYWPWLINCPIYIAKCYRLCGCNNRSVLVTILKVQDEGVITLFLRSLYQQETAQQGLMLRASGGKNSLSRVIEVIILTNSHYCLSSTGTVIHAQHLPGQSYISILTCQKKTTGTSSSHLQEAPDTVVPWTICYPETIQGSPSYVSPVCDFTIFCVP